jgi:hypothetical protein
MTCPHCNFSATIENEHLLFDDWSQGEVLTQHMVCGNCNKPFKIQRDEMGCIYTVEIDKLDYKYYKEKIYDKGFYLILKEINNGHVNLYKSLYS